MIITSNVLVGTCVTSQLDKKSFVTKVTTDTCNISAEAFMLKKCFVNFSKMLYIVCAVKQLQTKITNPSFRFLSYSREQTFDSIF